MTSRFKSPWDIRNTEVALLTAYSCEVNSRGHTFKYDDDTIKHIKEMSQWLVEGNTNGIILCGTVGNGKTTMTKALKNLVQYICNNTNVGQHRLELVDARQLCDLAKNDYDEFKRLCRTEMLCIDDLGIEPVEVLDYGNALNPSIELLTERYKDQLFTVVSTNLTPKDIGERYGARIKDRFKEMFTRIAFKNPTYRGK